MDNKPENLLVIMGGTGDLTRLKLLPALRDLWVNGKLAPGFKLIATGRRDYTTDDYTNFLAGQEVHPFTQDLSFLDLEYIQVDLDNPGGMNPLLERLKDYQERNILLYLALAPDIMHKVLDRFKDPEAIKLPSQTQISVIAEKPFGEDLEDAKQLSKEMVDIFRPQHVFRNDHYLNKDTVQALIPIRASDQRISGALRSDMLREVQVIVSESEGLGTRAGYFDCRGMLVDWVQSHMLQLLATMFADLDNEDLNMAKAEFLNSLTPQPSSIIRAQYEGYGDIPGVNTECETDTFFAVHLTSNLSAWDGVVFSLISGKALSEKSVMIRLLFKKPHPIFEDELMLHLDPPGGHKNLKTLSGDEFSETIMNGLNQESKKFVSQKEIEAQWRVTEQIQDHLDNSPLQYYKQGISYQDYCNDKWCRHKQ